MTLHNISPWKIGLLQTVIVLAYILTGALVVTSPAFAEKSNDGFIQWLPAIGILAVLSTFVFSALFCATTMLGYPTLLCFEKNYRRAIQVIFWSIGWLALFLVSMALIAIVNLSMA